ncbi:hypothetical protein MRB53_032823 [Persea americana]|uniref:Uncharacterized protein n=1 Tax=Persea americana TaxID=3435 RepID=A0ACC2KTI4_PERAE|nr:hypothetical protein MRB53_032823 [Persea americana]|eukprot:TRINITY_DN774_c1_g1_i1.p1 TRINITY_DN774_c1_g1~~TRINITY_DN774_c1_g1_i1.p1  ORF type:complete len:273 (-),score=63.69 TRINITY_DN774_c1_g1_i1:256-1074(-)
MSSGSCEALAGAWKLSSTGAQVRKGKWKHQQCHMMSLHPRKKNEKEKEKEKEKLSTFSASITTDLPLYESPAASFDEYLSDRSRIFQAMFPDNKQRSQRLNDDEWRIQMLPLDFFFLSVRPLIDIRLECKSEGKNYPPGVPLHVSRMLELEVTRWELPGLDGVLRPSHFSLGVRGALYSERQGIQSRLKGQLEMSVSCILPRELALVPDDVLRGVSETVLKRLVENMKQNVNERLLLDFSNFRRERFQIKGEMVMQPQPPNQLGSEQTFNDI